MSETTGDRTHINRTIYQLDLLRKRLSPQEFGRVMQQALACAFEAAGFRVVENAIGVPDFTATSPMTSGESQTLAVEVKTSDKSKIVLTKRGLDGIRTPGQSGVLAVLDFPALNPRWLLIPETSVTARSWEIRHLRMKPQVDVGFDVDEMFHRIMGCLEAGMAPGGPDLDGWIKAQRHAFHAMNSRQAAP
jgi:hypothetical protein